MLLFWRNNILEFKIEYSAEMYKYIKYNIVNIVLHHNFIINLLENASCLKCHCKLHGC